MESTIQATISRTPSTATQARLFALLTKIKQSCLHATRAKRCAAKSAWTNMRAIRRHSLTITSTLARTMKTSSWFRQWKFKNLETCIRKENISTLNSIRLRFLKVKKRSPINRSQKAIHNNKSKQMIIWEHMTGALTSKNPKYKANQIAAFALILKFTSQTKPSQKIVC